MVSLAAQHRQATLAAEAKEAAAPAPKPVPTPIAPPPPDTLSELVAPSEPIARAESPASRYRREALARLAIEGTASAGSAAERPSEGAAATEYELLLADLGADLVRLKGIMGGEAKEALKAELIGKYDVHVDATLAAAREADAALQDEIVTHMLIWRIDVKDFERALDIGEHVLDFNLRMPTRFVRTPATMLAEEIAEAAFKADRANKDFPLDIIDRTMTVTESHDMPDQVRAKLYKARGRLCLRAATAMEANPATVPAGGPRAGRLAALAAFRRALELDKGCGVKKDIERLAPLERAATPEADTNTGADTGAE